MGNALQVSEQSSGFSRILVVEDDGLQQEMLGSALRRQGCEVETTVDGLDAVWKICEGSYDLVLIDYRLPEIDGLATARLVHDLMGEVARPVLVALTGSPDRLRNMEGVPGSAFDDIIAKSGDLPELLSRISRHLKALPDRSTRRAAEASLLLQNWAEFDGDLDAPSRSGDKSTPARILVVEDDDLQQLVLRSALESRGYIVETVSDGLQAVRMIRGESFDLVLVDYQIPGIDGLATARLIVSLMNENVRPRMIALTSAPERLSSRQAETGSSFDEVVAKSSDLPALLAIVDRYLRASPARGTRRAAHPIHPMTPAAQSVSVAAMRP